MIIFMIFSIFFILFSLKMLELKTKTKNCIVFIILLISLLSFLKAFRGFNLNIFLYERQQIIKKYEYLSTNNISQQYVGNSFSKDEILNLIEEFKANECSFYYYYASGGKLYPNKEHSNLKYDELENHILNNSEDTIYSTYIAAYNFENPTSIYTVIIQEHKNNGDYSIATELYLKELEKEYGKEFANSSRKWMDYNYALGRFKESELSAHNNNILNRFEFFSTCCTLGSLMFCYVAFTFIYAYYSIKGIHL